MILQQEMILCIILLFLYVFQDNNFYILNNFTHFDNIEKYSKMSHLKKN